MKKKKLKIYHIDDSDILTPPPPPKPPKQKPKQKPKRR